MEYRELTFHPLLLMLKPSYFHLVAVCILYDEPRIKIRCIVLFNFFFVMLLLNSFHSTRVLHFGLQIKFLNGMHIRMGSFIKFFFSSLSALTLAIKIRISRIFKKINKDNLLIKFIFIFLVTKLYIKTKKLIDQNTANT